MSTLKLLNVYSRNDSLKAGGIQMKILSLVQSLNITFFSAIFILSGASAQSEERSGWQEYISIVDSSAYQQAFNDMVKVDQQMLFHMNTLQNRVQSDLTKFQPVIVAQFTPGGGKFTLLRSEYGNESRVVVEPVSRLFAISKSIAHAPLGIYGSFGSYAANADNQNWREPVAGYGRVLKQALASVDSVEKGIHVDEKLKNQLVNNLNQITAKFDGSSPQVNSENVMAHVANTWRAILRSSIDLIDNKLLVLPKDQSPAASFQEWSNKGSTDSKNPNDTLYKLIVQSQVIAATAQRYGISTLMNKWKNSFTEEEWKNLYVIVEAEWVTRDMNSIAQSILPIMADKEKALSDHLLITTNLSDVQSALHFLARILEDRAAAALILTNHTSPREHLSGHVDLLGPIMKSVVSASEK